MKVKLLLTFAILFVVVIAKSQNSIPNGNFESWTTTQYMDPQNYNSSNGDMILQNIPVGCTRSSVAYHGNYAVQLTTQHSDGMSYFSNYVPNSPPPWHGGMPYNQTPTGIRGYYMSNIPAGDSALIAVNFSVGGNNINFYIYKLFGNHTTYTPFNFTFNPPLTQTPDSVIFIAISSDAMNNIAITGSTITLDSISFTGVQSQPANFNGDFEQWDSKSIINLDSWYKENNYNGNLVLQSNDVVAGNFAAELTTFQGDRNGIPRAEGMGISTSYWDDSCQCEKGGHPFSNQVDTLEFWYKYLPSGNDTAEVRLDFKKNGNYIYNSGYHLLASSSYQKYLIPINLPQLPDTVIIYFRSSIWGDSLTSFIGSVLKLDEIHFKSQPLNTGIKQIFNNSDVSIYPNPGKGVYRISSGTKISTIEIYNNLGQTVYSKSINGYIANVDLSNQSKGVFIYKVKTDTGNIKTGKIVIE